MDYRFSKQASLSIFSPYFLLYGIDLVLPASIRDDIHAVLNTDDFNMWIEVCNTRVRLFQRIMPMVFDNLAIA